MNICIVSSDAEYLLYISKGNRLIYTEKFSSLVRLYDIIDVIKQKQEILNYERTQTKSKRCNNVRAFVESLNVNDVFCIETEQRYFKIVDWVSKAKILLQEISNDVNIGEPFEKVIKSVGSVSIDSKTAKLQNCKKEYNVFNI